MTLFFIHMISMFFWIRYQIQKNWNEKFLNSYRWVPYLIGTFFIFMGFLLSKHLLLLALGLILTSPLIFLCRKIIFEKILSDFQEKTKSILDSMILFVGQGHGLVESLLETSKLLTGPPRGLLEETATLLHWKIPIQGVPVEKFSFAAQILRMDLDHRILDQLQAWREAEKMKIEFRRKSRQATAGLRAQALLLSGMFALLVTYVLISKGWDGNEKFLVPSFLMFVIGLGWIFRLGKRIKWNI
jgi:FtsH-binding integral membrane protein